MWGMKKIPLSPQWRRALETLAIAGESGSAETALMARGFSAEMLKSLVRVGFAAPITHRVRIAGPPAPSIRITDAGRRAIEGSRLMLTGAA